MTNTITTVAGAVELGRVRILPLSTIRPSPENAKLYRPILPEDPATQALTDSIRKNGIKEPLVITEDMYILSGHRRHVAAGLAGLTVVPCRIEPIWRDGDPDGFTELLATYNVQRVKTIEEQVREEIVFADPEVAYQSLIEHRAEKAKVRVAALAMGGWRRRAEITEAKRPLLNAVIRIINARREFWPLSDRQIHYALLNDPPLIHGSKPGSRYRNDVASYKAAVELLTRARLDGSIPMGCIADPTRPVTIWGVHSDAGAYVRKTLDGLFRGYWRNLMQSQPCHIEIIGEKLTVQSILRPVAMKYRIPLTIGRGYASLPARAGVAERFRKSGKDRLVLLLVSDFDPDGEQIAESFARSLRDDFDIYDIHPVRVALTAQQVERYDLPPGLKAKSGSSRFKGFVDRHGDDVWELEALEPAALQQELTNAIDAVLDRQAFNAELEAEKHDAAELAVYRVRVLAALGQDGEGTRHA